MEQCIVCKKSFKKGRGIKIHQKKSGCFRKLRDPHRKLDKSEAVIIPEKHHSDDGSLVDPSKKKATHRTTGDTEAAKADGKKHSKGGRGEENRREEMCNEVEIEVHVEEEIYKEVNDILQEVNEEKARFMQENKQREKRDIRNWFGNPKDDLNDETVVRERGRAATEGKKNSTGAKSKGEEERKGKKDEQTHALRGVRSRGKQTKSTEDIRTWIERKQGSERPKNGNERSQASVEGDARKVVVEGDTRIVVEKGCKKREDMREVVVEGDTRTVVANECKKREDILKGPSKEILARHGFGLNLKREDFRSLMGKNYLNDQVIDQYLILLQRRNETTPNLPKIHACTTFLYTKLKRFGVEEGRKQTERWIPEDLLEKDLILFPIHNLSHWSLVVVDTGSKTIHYLDSLIGSRQNSAAPWTMKEYMEKLHREKGEAAVYKIQIREDAPYQTNGVDCGVFLCQYAEAMTRKSWMSFTQRDMAQARERMIEELLGGKVVSD